MTITHNKSLYKYICNIIAVSISHSVWDVVIKTIEFRDIIKANHIYVKWKI